MQEKKNKKREKEREKEERKSKKDRSVLAQTIVRLLNMS